MTQKNGSCRGEGRVRAQRVKALSISGPVFDVARTDGLTGRVFANHRRACNLVTSGREVIALVDSAIGNGPLNIVIEETGVFEQVKPGLPAVFSDGQLVLGDSLVVLLDEAQLWRPKVNWECLATQRRRLEDGLAVLCGWLSQNDIAEGLLDLSTSRIPSRGGSHAAKATAHSRAWEPALLQNRDLLSRAFLGRARAGINGLLRALQDGDRSGIRESAALLAGLGPGLTPAGDDYLVGLMAGLRVWPGPLQNSGLSPQEVCQIIFEATEGRTTLLSRAFLRSAQEGLFGENWHELLAALVRGEPMEIQRAARRILSSGATSGADALAGFLSPYLWHRSGDFSRPHGVRATKVATTKPIGQDRVGQKLNQHGR